MISDKVAIFVNFANFVSYLIGSNPLAVAVFACVKCLLKCLECCLDIVSKHGLVFTVLYGTPFCHSCASSFRLLFSNLARVAAVTAVSRYLEFLGKVGYQIRTIRPGRIF